MKVAITGSAGNLGSQVCAELVQRGHEIVAIDSRYRSGPGTTKVMNLLDPLPLYDALAGCEAVVHSANHPNDLGAVPPQRIYAENVAMDINVFQAAIDLGVRRILFASSVQVISGDRRARHEAPSGLAYLPLDENLPERPRNPYALSKQAGEQQLAYYAARDPGLTCVALRFPWLVPTDEIGFYQRSMYRRRWTLPNDEGFSYLTTRDAARLIQSILAAPATGYIRCMPAASDNSLGLSPKEVAARYYPDVPMRDPGRELNCLVDNSLAERLFGWLPADNGLFTEEAIAKAWEARVGART